MENNCNDNISIEYRKLKLLFISFLFWKTTNRTLISTILVIIKFRQNVPSNLPFSPSRYTNL